MSIATGNFTEFWLDQLIFVLIKGKCILYTIMLVVG